MPSVWPTLYFYNADLIDILASNVELASAFVDNCIVAARTPTVQGSNDQVVDMVTRPNGVLEWSHDHTSKFELDKTGLIVFTNRRVSDPVCPQKTVPLSRLAVTIMAK